MKSKKLLVLLTLIVVAASLAAMVINRGIARSDEELLALLRKEQGLPAESELLILDDLNGLLCVADQKNHVFYAVERAPYWDGWQIERIYTNGSRKVGVNSKYGSMYEKGQGVYFFDWQGGRIFAVDNPAVATLLFRCRQEERSIGVENTPSIYYVEDFFLYQEYFFLDKGGNDLFSS